jgi:hypothetical protein
MSLWGYPNAPAKGDANSDIATFSSGQTQPPDRTSILLGWYRGNSLSGTSYNWRQIAAVEIDEPYSPDQHDPAVGSIDNSIKASLAAKDCSLVDINEIKVVSTGLEARAKELQSFAPWVRFWVNIDSLEAEWIQACNSPLVFNEGYIDVFSFDAYQV